MRITRLGEVCVAFWCWHWRCLLAGNLLAGVTASISGTVTDCERRGDYRGYGDRDERGNGYWSRR